MPRVLDSSISSTRRSSAALLVGACLAGVAVFVPARALQAQAATNGQPTARDSAQTLDAVVVKADRGRRAAYGVRTIRSATRTDLPLRDTPQAVSVVGAALVSDLSMQSMADVVRFVPGVTMAQGEGHRDAPVIRGNSSTADFFVDGIRDDAQYLRDVYNVERVEALKGANAMTFGRGGGGGVINRVTKAADWTPARALTFEGGSFAHARATLDANQPIGQHVAARITGVRERSEAFRDAASLERTGVNPSAAFLVGGAMVRTSYEFFDDRRVVDRGIPSFRGRPSDVAIRTFFGNPDTNRARATVHAADATIERGSTERLLLRNHSRLVSYDKFYQNVFPGAVDSTGARVSLSAYNNSNDRLNVFNQTDLSRAVRTGMVTQTLLAGVEVGHQRTDNFRNTGYFGSATSTQVSLASPVMSTPVAFRQSATDADNHVTADVAAAYVQDQVAVGSHWQAIVGVRYDRFDLRFHDNRTDKSLRRDDRLVSPRAGLVFKPVQALSFYGSYGVSHLPSSGDQFSSLTATTQTLEPERFQNREVGVKWELRGDLAVSGALFRLDRSNSAAPDPVDPTRTVQTGRQRTSGGEIAVTGSITTRWQVAGGYSNQHAEIVNRTSAAKAGATVPLVPHHTVQLWNRVQLLRRLGVGAGVIHQADMYAAIDNVVTLPSFTRVDAAAYVTLTRALKGQVNLENVLDTRYYATSQGNNNIMPGAPRTVRVSLTVAP